MSTRSTISILNKDGSIDSVYCHSDGYLAYNGEYLLMYYNEKDRVEKLISMGGISSLDKEIDIPPGVSHSFNFDLRAIDISVFYKRDRQDTDDLSQTQKFTNLEHFLEKGNLQGYDYVFKVKNNTWYLINNNKLKIEPLKNKLLKNPKKTQQFEFFIKSKEIEKSYYKLKDKFNNLQSNDQNLFTPNKLKI